MAQEKERAAAQMGTPGNVPGRAGGTQNSIHGGNNTKTIIQHYDHLCTVAATTTHDLAHLAQERDSGTLTWLALHLERVSRDLHAIGQVLPIALMLATLESEVAA